MKLRAIGLAAAGLVVTGGLIAGTAEAHTDAEATPPPQPSTDTPSQVTGHERALVADAIQRRDKSVSVHAVRRGADGTFHALGSKAGEPVLAEVSKNRERVSLQVRPNS